MNLHGEIMNIQIGDDVLGGLTKIDQFKELFALAKSTQDLIFLAYKIGHRDARHAAAELSLRTAPHAQRSRGGWISVLERLPDDKRLPREGWLVYAPRRTQAMFFTHSPTTNKEDWSGLSYGFRWWYEGSLPPPPQPEKGEA